MQPWLEDRHVEVRKAALRALVAMGPERTAPHGSAIAARLQDRNVAVRVAALGALGKMGEHTRTISLFLYLMNVKMEPKESVKE
jgi:HEAT repeat protein